MYPVRGQSSLWSTGTVGTHHNLAAGIALGGLKAGTIGANRAMERLSTGMRINRPSDDVSAFVATDKLRHQITGIDAALKTTQIARNTLDAAQGGLTNIYDNLVRLRSLALKAMSSDIATTDRSIFQDEADQIIDRIDAVVRNTTVGGNRVLDGSGDFNIESTPGAFDAIQVKRARFNQSGERGLTVGIRQIASRATVLTNLDLAGANNLVLGGASTLTIAGPKGSSNVPVSGFMSAGDVATAINAAAEGTGVYASSHITVGAELRLAFNDIDVDLEVTGGNTVTFDVSVGGSMANVTMTATGDRDADGNLEFTADDFERALNSANFGNFGVLGAIDTTGGTPVQNLIIRHAGAADFTISNFANATGTIGGGSALNGLNQTGTEPTAARIITSGTTVTGPRQFNVQVISGGTSSLITRDIANTAAADLAGALTNVATVTSLGLDTNGNEILLIEADASVDAFRFVESRAGSTDASDLGLLSDSGGGNGLASRGMAVLALYSEEFGSTQQVSLRNTGASSLTFSKLNETAPAVRGLPSNGGELGGLGTDVLVEIDGKVMRGRGFSLNYSDAALDVTLDLAPRLGAGSFTNAMNRALALDYADPASMNLLGTRPLSRIYDDESFEVTDASDPTGTALQNASLIDKVSFTVRNYWEDSARRSGLGVQLGAENGNREFIGIRSFDSSFLGGLPTTEGGPGAESSKLVKGVGTISQIRRSGGFSLEGDRFQIQHSIAIIDRAISQTLRAQTQIGLYQTQTLDRNRDHLASLSDNLIGLKNDLETADIAVEATNLAAAQMRVQAATSLLAQANQNPQTLLTLLR